MYPIPRPIEEDVLLRVNADIIIDTEAHPREVVQTLVSDVPRKLSTFPHGFVVKFEVLSQERVTNEEAHQRGWVE